MSAQAGRLHRVLVLGGGLNPERDVSLRSGQRVAEALRAQDVDTELADVDAGILATLGRVAPDAVFIALHGSAGEDGAVRAVLELAGVPYVGSRPAACRLAFDKPTAKTVVAGWGVATPAAVTLAESTFRDLGASPLLRALVQRLGLPLMVKPARGGSALGATIVRASDELPAAMVVCFGYDDTALVERYIVGTELAVSVLDTGDGPRALPPVQVRPTGGCFDYVARYTAGATSYDVPAPVPSRISQAAQDAAVAAHRALGLRHLSRTDLIVAQDGTIEFLEVNVAPGMTHTSLWPMAVAAAGEDLGAVCARLLVMARDGGVDPPEDAGAGATATARIAVDGGPPSQPTRVG